MKQKTYIAGLYFRLSQEDERQGESTSIENQRTILRKYALDHGFQVHDEYIDDGFSGTTFNRPGVQRLLDDAKNGVINMIIVKDMSRFGKKELQTKKRRIEDLDKVIQNIYEDKVNGKMDEKTCFNFIEKYNIEKDTLINDIESLEKSLKNTEDTKRTADDFIKAFKKYLNAPKLTREMCYELIDRIIVGGLPQIICFIVNLKNYICNYMVVCIFLAFYLQKLCILFKFR